MRRLVLLTDVADTVRDHLFAAAPLESGCFCLLRQGRGVRGTRLLAGELLLPPENDAWDMQHSNQLTPSARWMSACISAALRERAGLLWIHSHPDPGFPTAF